MPAPTPPAALVVPAAGVDRLDGYFPNSVLLTHDGEPVRFYDDLLPDKLVLVQFLFTRCEGICPGVTENLLQVQEALGERLGREVFDAIRRRLGVFDPDPVVDADKSQHSGKVVLCNERLGRWGSIPGAVGPKRILRMLERIEGPSARGAAPGG